MSKCAICQEKIWFYQKSLNYYHCQHSLHQSCFQKLQKHNHDGLFDVDTIEGSHYFCPSCRGIIKGKYYHHWEWNLDPKHFHLLNDHLSQRNSDKFKKKLISSVLDQEFQNPEFLRKYNQCILNGHILKFNLADGSTLEGFIKGDDIIQAICMDCQFIKDHLK